MNRINIRPYEACDRQALRDLCCNVADRGAPIENFFPDREVAADLLTRYYTDYEPESSFVAVDNGRVVGYVNGCLDNRRYGLVTFWLLLPAVLAKAFKRGLFFRTEVHQLLKGALRNWRRLFSWRKSSFHSHQGHLHIGIAADFRGRQVGRQLIDALVNRCRRSGIIEIAASVHDANTRAGEFFQREGFKIRERNPMILIRNGREEHYHSLLYVKTIQAH